jgi:hypothetical protein
MGCLWRCEMQCVCTGIALHCIALHCTALHCSTLHCTALCCAVHCAVLQQLDSDALCAHTCVCMRTCDSQPQHGWECGRGCAPRRRHR